MIVRLQSVMLRVAHEDLLWVGVLARTIDGCDATRGHTPIAAL